MSAPASQTAAPVLAIDPGRDKCGMAVVDGEGRVLQRQIAARSEVVAAVVQWWEEYQPTALLLGDATGKRQLEAELHRALPQAPIAVVNERDSTLEARSLYWEAHPPQGWRRVVPLSLQVPPVPLDDFAAVIVAQRYLKSHNTSR